MTLALASTARRAGPAIGGKPKRSRRVRLLRGALAVLAVLVVGLAVVLASGSSRANLPLLAPDATWTVSADAPAISAGSLRSRALWNDPSVIRNPDGSYTMYATTSVAEPFKPPILPFRLTSRDGKTWSLSPVGPLLTAQGGFTAVETPSVVQFGGRWHMFFTGTLPEGSSAPMAIGHALSSDGIRWTFDPSVRFSATGEATDWNGYLIGEPGAVVVGDTLRVYFSAVGARPGGNPPQLQSIGVVESRDGRQFGAPRQVLGQSPRYRADQGFVGYSSPAAAMIGSDLHLWYSVAWFEKGANPEWNQVAIAHAVSAGADAPFVETDAPVLTLRSTRWATGEILAPAPLVDGDRVLLWFGGHVPVQDLGPLIRNDFKGPDFGIGLASTPLPVARTGPSSSRR